MFRHIVVACDGSPGSRDAVALGGALASATGARMSLVGVFPTAFLPVPGATDRKTLRAQMVRLLRRERDAVAPEASVHAVADFSVARALLHYAERQHGDLVVVGSSRSAPAGRVAISRRARQLLYSSPFALAIAARGSHDLGARLDAIGIGYDGGPEAQAALSAAADLASAAKARLAVRGVVDDWVPAFSAKEWMAAVDVSPESLWEPERERFLAEAEAAAARTEVAAETSVTIGNPADQLRQFSDGLDLLVVGSRRWGPVARLVSGGVGEALVSGAGCSVLIVPRPPAPRRRPGPPHRRESKTVTT